MKKTLKNMLMLALVLALCLSLCACGGTTETPDSAAEGADTQSAGVDYSQYPEDFNDWTNANLKAYLRETGVLEHTDWIIDVSGGDLDAIGATGGFMYIDMNGGTIMDMIFYFDSANESQAAVLDGLRETRAIQPDVEDVPATPMDAMLGNFCFSYTMGVDAEHNAALCQAIHDLAEHFGITPDFITE